MVNFGEFVSNPVNLNRRDQPDVWPNAPFIWLKPGQAESKTGQCRPRVLNLTSTHRHETGLFQHLTGEPKKSDEADRGGDLRAVVVPHIRGSDDVRDVRDDEGIVEDVPGRPEVVPSSGARVGGRLVQRARADISRAQASTRKTTR